MSAPVEAIPGEPPKISKRAEEKERKKAEAKAKKAALAASKPPTTKAPAAKAAGTAPIDPNLAFKQGWLKGVYSEKPVVDVRTRFPPEPNGFLHIGHAKAITVNFGFAKAYGGTCNLRFDDTNPGKEEKVYFDSIEEIVAWLGFKPHKVTHSSDFFDELYDFAEELIKRGKAYMCYCSKEMVQRGRGILTEKTPDGKPKYGARSVCKEWHASIEQNLKEFRELKNGKYAPGEAHLRMRQFLGTQPAEYEILDDDTPEIKQAKTKLKNMSDNSALWDMAAYRVPKDTQYHHKTGDKWKIYPTYEFTHCIVDQLEGITHSLCTVEFETLRPAYDWLLEALDLKDPASDAKGPMQREYGRLSVEGTILSKRHIAKLVYGSTAGSAAVEAKDAADGVQEMHLNEDEPTAAVVQPSTDSIPPVVRGWDDPRLFTLIALRRRGIPPGALKQFVLDLGITKANADTRVAALEAAIRTSLERSVPRLMLVLDPIKITIENLPEDHLEEFEAPFDPKDASKGSRKVPFTRTIYIDRDDFREVDDPDFFRLAPGKSVGLLYVTHPLRATRFTKDTEGRVNEIFAEYGPDVPAAKSRIHWVGECESHDSPINAECRLYNPLFNVDRPDIKGGKYRDDLNPDSEVIYKNAMIENGYRHVRKTAPWPQEDGEATSTVGNYSVRFQGVRTAYFCLDSDATDEKIVFNRIVSLREDSGKK